MGRKPKYTKIMKIQACIDYLSGTHSVIEIAQKLNMPKQQAKSMNGLKSMNLLVRTHLKKDKQTKLTQRNLNY